jgi:mannosyl-oligosaccharide alpha-1,2-mannosidase
LSAHALTGDKLFLSRALSLGKRLLGAFKTDTQLPAPNVNLKTRRPAWGWG